MTILEPAPAADLRASADRWVRTSPERKRDLLDAVLRATEPLIASISSGFAAGARRPVSEAGAPG
jgi:hypothetical protein